MRAEGGPPRLQPLTAQDARRKAAHASQEEEGTEGASLEAHRHRGRHGWLSKGLETPDVQQELEYMKKCVCVRVYG